MRYINPRYLLTYLLTFQASAAQTSSVHGSIWTSPAQENGDAENAEGEGEFPALNGYGKPSQKFKVDSTT